MITITNEDNMANTCTIQYFDKAMRPIRTITTEEAHWLNDVTNQRLIGTPNEYMIVMKPFKGTSFIEVWHQGVFIARHFQREGVITPLVSYEQDRSKCDLIRKRQIAIKPTLDWKRITRDSFWGNKPKLSLEDMVKELETGVSKNHELYKKYDVTRIK